MKSINIPLPFSPKLLTLLLLSIYHEYEIHDADYILDYRTVFFLLQREKQVDVIGVFGKGVLISFVSEDGSREMKDPVSFPVGCSLYELSKHKMFL